MKGPAATSRQGELPRYHRVLAAHGIDGDTIEVDISLGFNIELHGIRCRLFGINAPEVHGDTKAEGLRSAKALADILAGAEGRLYIQSGAAKHEHDNFGRWIVRVMVVENGEFVDVNKKLVEDGFAVPYMVND